MSSANRTSCRKDLLILWIVLFWFSTSALISKDTRIGLPDVIRWGIIFGGVNVAAAWAALGPGTSLLRQFCMAIVTALLVGGIAIAFTVSESRSMRANLYMAGDLSAFFFAAQIPFWFARAIRGIRLAEIGCGEPWAFTLRFRLRHLIMAMLMVAVAEVAVRLASPPAQDDVALWYFAMTGGLMFVCVMFNAPFAVSIAFSDNIRKGIFQFLFAVACSWIIGVMVFISFGVRLAGLAMSYEDIFYIGLLFTTQITVIVVVFCTARASGIRLRATDRSPSPVGD